MAQTEKRNAVIYINGVEVNNTMSSIEKHARGLRNEMAHLTRGTDEFNKKLEELKSTNKIIAQHRQSVLGVNKAWQDVKMQLKGFGATLLAYLGGSAVVSGFQNLIQKNAELAKTQTAVQRTTKLSNEQMELLNKNLGKMSTKTARMELLKLAEEAGKQGKSTVEEVTQFVGDMDKAIVALGGDLGPAVIEQLGKLSTIFDTSTLKIGNAIKAIADSSIASAPYQVDFMMRTAGVAETVGVASDELMGYGAALENLGQSQEVSGTAINQFLLKLTQNTEEFGQIAGFAKGELKTLIGEKGTNAGFIAFLEKLKETSTGTDDLITKLNDLGLDGTRNAAVLLTLANNTELVAKQQAVAKNAIGDTSLIMDSFNKANSDFAANWEKFMKNVGAFFMNNAVSKGFMNLIGRLVDTRTEAEKAAEAFQEQKQRVESLEKQLIPLRDRYIELQSTANRNKEEQAELNKIIATVSTILPTATSKWDKYGNAVDISTKKINDHIAAEKELVRLQNADAIKATYKEIDTLIMRIDANAAELQRGYNLVAGKGANSDKVTKVPLTLEQMKQLQQGMDEAKAKVVENFMTIEKTLGQTLSATDQFKMQLYALTSTGVNLAASYYNEVGDAAKQTGDAVENANTTVVEGMETLGSENGPVDKASKKMTDLALSSEDIRQEIYLLSQDEFTNALYELDKQFEDLILRATAAGLTDEEISRIYDLWTEAALKLEEQFKNTTTASDEMLKRIDSLGGKSGNNSAEAAAKARRESINAETDATIKLREEHEKYVESLFQAGAAAVENAETQQDAIKAVINAIREAIKQRIMEAIATTVGKALAELPFPLNIALATAAGAAATTLFDKFVPQAADGGYYTDVVGRQNGQKYRAQVNQRFMGGYAHQPMLVGEAGAEYTVPSFLMKNPYVVSMVDSIEGMRKGQGAKRNSEANSIDLTEVIGRMDVMIQQMKEGKNVVMPDQTIKEFQKRLQLLEILSTIPFR